MQIGSYLMFLIKNCQSHQFYCCKSQWIFIGLILKGIWNILDSVFILAVIHSLLFSSTYSCCWGSLQDSIWINNRNKIYFFTLTFHCLFFHATWVLSLWPVKSFQDFVRSLFSHNCMSFPYKINRILTDRFLNMHTWLLELF